MIDRRKWYSWLLEGHGSSHQSDDDDYRVIKLEPDNDPVVFNPYPKNKIVTNKYTVFTFVPKNLFEQFRRVGNFYFLMSAVISTVIKSPISPLTSWLPLLFVIMVTAVKQGYEDLMRYRSDQKVNGHPVTVIRRKCSQEIFSEDIVVGDIVRIERDQDVPCDMVILHCSELSGKCYVTTSNLDGETNLKTQQVPRVFHGLEIDEIVSMTLTCILPIAGLYTFEGKVEATVGQADSSNQESRNGPLGIDNILLRGSRLKDTDYIYGIAVYTGADTKLSLNSQLSANKFSVVERAVNKYILILIIFLLFEVCLCYLLKNTAGSSENSSKFNKSYLGNEEQTDGVQILTDLLSFTILFNFIVPISLYVTIEMQSFLGSFFFTWDLKMFDEEPAIVNTSELNEDLGQVEFLFSDKTGTLTDNCMIFRRCFVDGNSYVEKDCDGNLRLLPLSGQDRFAETVELWTPELWHFMISISLCHEVHIAPPNQKAKAQVLRTEYRESYRLKKTQAVNSSLMMDPNLPEYEAASVDEKALVEAAARCGVIFQGDNNSDDIEIDAKGTKLNYERLDVFEFTSDRKRMSVIIKDTADDIWLYCKGADSSVFPLIKSQGQVIDARNHVTDFSRRGLRTLVVGYKKFTKEEYEILREEVNSARQTMGPERGRSVERIYEQIELGLTLLGVSAVEDRLQDGVVETMEKLRAAGIKIWVLTGDKAETAENIAYFCGHFKRGTEIFRLTNIYADQLIFITLISFERKMKLEPYAQYGLIVDGVSLGIALNNCPTLLRKVAMACEAVVCCRMSPLQKSQMVQLVKNSPEKPLTAAVGDGGNDVSMIKEAHVGLGITGKEGRQAAMSADFAFAKFRHLERALLVLGHWYYLRLANLTMYFFYKNLVLTIPQLIFTMFSGFSGQALYDSMFLMGFNLFFSSMPIIIYGLFEQDFSDETLLRLPQLYQLYRKNELLSMKTFLTWASIAVYQACACFFIPFFYWKSNCVIMYNGTPGDMWSFSITIFHLVVLIINVELLILSSYWTIPFVLCLALTELFFLLFSLVYSYLGRNYDGDMYYVFINLLWSPSFYFLTALVLAVCMIPPLLIGIYDRAKPQRLQGKLETREHQIRSTLSTFTPVSPSRQVSVENNIESRRRTTNHNRLRRGYLSSPVLPNRRPSTVIPWRGNLTIQENRTV